MATFTKRGSKWFAQVCVNGTRKSKTFPGKAQARSWAMEQEAILSESDGVVPSKTFSELLTRYGEEITPTKRSAESELKRLTAFKRSSLGPVLLTDLSREHFEQYINQRLKGVKGSSINRDLNIVSNCLTYARRWNWMKHNPMDDLKRPKNPKHRDRRIWPDEIKQVLIAHNYSEDVEPVQKQQQVAVMFLLAIETAMRSGEMCGLTVDDVDLERRVAHLPMTKNGTARDVPLSSRAVELLQKVMRGKDGLIFDLTDKRRVAIFKKCMAKTTIEGLTFHDTRHEAITRLAKKLDVLDLARMVGHRDIKQLMTYYNSTAEELAAQLD